MLNLSKLHKRVNGHSVSFKNVNAFKLKTLTAKSVKKMYVVRPFFGLYTRRNEIWWNPYCGCGENVVGLDAAFVAEVAKSDDVNELCCFEGFFAVVVDVVAGGDVDFR